MDSKYLRNISIYDYRVASLSSNSSRHSHTYTHTHLLMSGTIKRSSEQASVRRWGNKPSPHLRSCWHPPSPSPRQPGRVRGLLGQLRLRKWQEKERCGGRHARFAFMERNTNETDQDRPGRMYSEHFLTWSGILMPIWQRYTTAESEIHTEGTQCQASSLSWKTQLRFSQCAVALIWACACVCVCGVFH